jgi:repressor LexA
MTARNREKVYDFVCRYFDAKGHAPTLYEIGAEFGITHVGAWKHVQALIAEGLLSRASGHHRALRITGRVDLRPVPTDKLVSEIARRRAVGHARASR